MLRRLRDRRAGEAFERELQEHLQKDRLDDPVMLGALAVIGRYASAPVRRYTTPPIQLSCKPATSRSAAFEGRGTH